MLRCKTAASAPVALLAVLLAGCTAGEPMPQLHPVTGRVVRDGKPVSAGGLIFVPDGGGGSSLIVNAAVETNGTFHVRTERTLPGGKLVIEPGAPAGRYKAIYHPPSNGATMGLEVELAERVIVDAGGSDVELALPTVMPKGAGMVRDDNPPAPGKR